MVIYGDPIPQIDHAERAINSAIQIQEIDKSFQSKWLKEYNTELEVGIGINTDEAILGTIGSEEYYDYTALGRGVNLASRLESGCPGGEIHVSKNTYDLLKEIYQFEFI